MRQPPACWTSHRLRAPGTLSRSSALKRQTGMHDRGVSSPVSFVVLVGWTQCPDSLASYCPVLCSCHPFSERDRFAFIGTPCAVLPELYILSCTFIVSSPLKDAEKMRADASEMISCCAVAVAFQLFCLGRYWPSPSLRKWGVVTVVWCSVACIADCACLGLAIWRPTKDSRYTRSTIALSVTITEVSWRVLYEQDTLLTCRDCGISPALGLGPDAFSPLQVHGHVADASNTGPCLLRGDRGARLGYSYNQS